MLLRLAQLALPPMFRHVVTVRSLVSHCRVRSCCGHIGDLETSLNLSWLKQIAFEIVTSSFNSGSPSENQRSHYGPRSKTDETCGKYQGALRSMYIGRKSTRTQFTICRLLWPGVVRKISINRPHIGSGRS